MDKRIHPTERTIDGACAACGRRHIHRDDCTTLKQREPTNDGTDRLPPPYAGGFLA